MASFMSHLSCVTPHYTTLHSFNAVVSSKDRSPESLQLAVTRMQQQGTAEEEQHLGPDGAGAGGGRVSRYVLCSCLLFLICTLQLFNVLNVYCCRGG